MALVLKDRVRETSTSTGTGTITLAGAVTGFQSFSAIGSGNTTFYTITMAGDWEVGIGTYTSPNQLSRDTVYESSNSNALVPFGSGTKDVFATFPAEGFDRPPAIGGTTPNTITGTTVTAKTEIDLPAVTVGNSGLGIIKMVDGGSGIDYLFIGGDDGSGNVTEVRTYGFSTLSDGIYPGFINFWDLSNAYAVQLVAPSSLAGNVVLTLPTSAGSNNQVLKTDGSGNLSWTPIQINTDITIPTVTPGNAGTGVYEMIDGGGGYDVLDCYMDDGAGGKYPIRFSGGVITNGQYLLSPDYLTNYQYINLTCPSGMSTYYTLTFPSTAGSNNQVLKTDGSGNLSWLDFGSPPAIGGTTPASGKFTTLTITSNATLTAIADPSAPSNGNVAFYGRAYGGYNTLAARNALNTPFGLQSALWSKNIQMWTPTTATAGVWLGTAGSGNGTYANVNPTTGGTKYQTIRRSTYANVITTTNQVLGQNNIQNCFFRGSVAGQGGFFYYARIGFDVWTNGGRFFAGLTANGSTVVSTDPSTTNQTVGFCVDAADNGAISFLTRASAATKASTGYTITSNKGYELYLYCPPNGTSITWEIVDINAGTSATGTATLNLPTNTTLMAPLAMAGNAALTPATSISFGIAKIYCESDY